MTDVRTKVLLVEDDRNIVDLIRSNLVVRGFDVLVSTDGRDVEGLVLREEPDLVVLDLMFPHADGFQILEGIRRRSSVGIIVISARGGEYDKVRALNLGADDYLTKPFGIEEFLARINATLRRTRPAETPTEDEAVVSVGDVEIDLRARRVTRGGEPVHLTPTEFALLRELARHRGALVSHATLLRRVWGPGYETATEYTRVYVKRLRAKLERDGAPLILTEPRMGYRLAVEPPRGGR